MVQQWRGLIEEYRDRLPVSAATPVITPCLRLRIE